MLPEVGGRQAHQHADGGGLAGAIGPEKTEKTAARNFQVETVHSRLVSIDLTEVVDRNRGAGAHVFHVT